jgi:hypothetical protein
MTYLLAGGGKLIPNLHNSNTYPQWSTLLSKKLGIKKVVDVGVGSNELTFNSIQDNIFQHTPKIITVLLTSWDSITPYGWHVSPFEIFELLIKKNINNQGNEECDKTNSLLEQRVEERLLTEYIFKYHMSAKTVINNNLRSLFLLQETCRELSIPLLVAQLFEPIRYLSWSDSRCLHISPHDPMLIGEYCFYRTVKNSVYFNIIDWDRISIGGPFFKNLGGKTIDQLIVEKSSAKKYEDVINGKQLSAEGHKLIAEIFHDEYKKKYLQI